MEDDYEEKNKQVKIHAFFICLCFFIIGSIAGTFFFFLYPNDILCDYTNNKYLCNQKICNKGFFGSNCLECKICINGYCDGSGTNKGTGKCICNKGWSGKLCDNCDIGFFGTNCSKCDDCINGYCDGSNTKSELGTGKCKCYQPYIGDNCDSCLDNYYGLNCTKKCTNSLCLDNKCNNDGSCKKCIEGYEGLNCNDCNKLYKSVDNKCILNTNLSEICSLPEYGYSITNNKYGLCKSCPKDNYGLICSGNGVCNGKGTVFGDGSCNCFGNYTGNLCQYNGILVNITFCKNSCNQNGNCLLYDNQYSCNCYDNYTETNCNDCRVGYVKNQINKCVRCEKGSNYFGEYCQKCNCQNGLCDDGIIGNGTCLCNKGFYGIGCNKCKNNYYGINCTKCSDCNNKGICIDGKLGNGKCICDFGYTGENCDECSNGFIKNNYHCEECPGSYAGKQNECFGNGNCIVENNRVKCNCNLGYIGISCSEKIISNCSNYNYCNLNGECLDNECYCKNNFYGDYCNETQQSYFMKTNLTSYYSTDSYSIVKNDIENNEKKSSVNTGDALGISILSVFLFVGCFVGTGWYIKYKPNPLKNYATNLTASRKIELTEEEKKYCKINPMFNISEDSSLFTKAMKNITLAVEKDNGHYFEDAIEFYNLGIDQLMMYLKHEANANMRFQLAKKIDVYVKRANYLKTVIQNRELINEIQNAPLAPVIN